MIGLTSLEVYISLFNITKGKNKFELYTFPVSKRGRVTYEKFNDEVEQILDNSDITATDSQDEITSPIIIGEYRKKYQKE